ncbi:MAG: SagB/ThcOx family dehydrogenase [Desulfovermiculus sp.]
MDRCKFLLILAVLAVAVGGPSELRAESDAVIDLPQPDRKDGMPLMQALDNRRSQRSFSSQELDRQTLSDLLWAAWGVNRDSGKRTAPSAHNRQEITVYCALEKGCYRYEGDQHRLVQITDKDLRAQTGRQGFVADAPLNLVFAADMDKASSEFYAACETGFISQNVYLYCASRGLATVVRGWFDQKLLAEAMGLPDRMRIILCQTVGYPD